MYYNFRSVYIDHFNLHFQHLIKNASVRRDLNVNFSPAVSQVYERSEVKMLQIGCTYITFPLLLVSRGVPSVL